MPDLSFQSRLAMRLLLLLALCLTAVPGWAQPTVKIKTSQGEITVELDSEKAPQTVANFLEYARQKHYDGTIFHRVIRRFMIQGGGLTPAMQEKPGARPAIKNEADNGLKNLKGTIAMARTGDPHSATDQFFINVVDNSFLDHRSKDEQGWGYAVFGKVVSGMEVAEKISRSATWPGDVPTETILIESVTLLK